MKARTLGLPMKCPTCPPRRYYGILKGDQVPTNLVKYTKADVCDNCKTPLVPIREGVVTLTVSPLPS